MKPLVAFAQTYLRIRLALEYAWTAEATHVSTRLPASITLVKSAIKDARDHRDKDGHILKHLKNAFRMLNGRGKSEEALRDRVTTVVSTSLHVPVSIHPTA